MKRMDVVAPIKRKNSEKTFWMRCGSAWPAKEGEGFDITLDAIPAPQDGTWRFIVRPPREDGKTEEPF